MWKEFREFISRGSVVDLAVGIIIGAAFTAVVNSLVNDVIMPPIGYAMGGADFADYFVNLSGGDYPSLEAAKAAGAAVIAYGAFINAIITFLVVAAVVFMLVKAINRVRRQEAQKPAEPPAPTREEQILIEIRDLLKQRPA
jgi:large conductance mechanosensitive channel